MKKLRLSLIIVLAFAVGNINAQSKKADVENTKIKWTGEKITGKHWGLIKLKSGELEVDNKKISSGVFVIDMTSITCDDLEDEGYNKKLIGHLESDDFFGTKNYPEAKLVIKEAAVFKKNFAKVKGDLTIKNKSNPIEFSVLHKDGDYIAKIIIDRSKYGIKYGSSSFFDNLGDKAISDNFVLDVKLVLKN